MKARPLPVAAILRYVAEHGPVDTVKLAAAMGVTRQIAFHRLRNAELSGHVVRLDHAPVGLNGRPGARWRMADAPIVDEPEPERDTAPMVQRRIEAGAWRLPPQPVARWCDGLGA